MASSRGDKTLPKSLSTSGNSQSVDCEIQFRFVVGALDRKSVKGGGLPLDINGETIFDKRTNNLRSKVAQCETGSSEIVQVPRQTIDKTLTDESATTGQSNVLCRQHSCNNLRNLLLKISQHG